MTDLDTLIDPSLSAGSSQTMAPNGAGHHNHDHAAAADDDDPIVATFNVLVKPSLPAHRRVLVLEHPTRSDASKPPRAPLELRTKPVTGMVELDFPVDFGAGYDKDKGKAWGAHLARSTEAKKGGSHGLAGGFGVGAPPPRARARGLDDASGGPGGGAAAADPSMMDWAEALRRDLVLRTQTLGGQTPDAAAESRYMVGVFAGSNLHLTPASSLVHLRPQLHHVDATTEQERLARGPGAAGGAGGAGGAGAAASSKPEAARAIHMTIKKTSDGSEELVQETMADRLKKVQSEAWRRHRYVHDEAADSWAVSEEALFLHGSGSGQAAAADRQQAAEEYGVAELADQVAALRTGWDEDDLLETTSGIKKKRKAAGPVKLEVSDDKPAGRPAAAKAKGKARAADAGGKPAGRAKATTAAVRGKKAANTTTEETAKAGPSARGKKNE